MSELSREGREEGEGRTLNPNPPNPNEEGIGKIILDSAFKVHSALGPGLLESAYEAALALELTKHGLIVERQKPIPIKYDGQLLDVAFRADLIVHRLVLVELESVETVIPPFQKTATNYLRLIPLRLGFLINFNEARLKNGITRITNRLEGKGVFGARRNVSEVDLKNPSPPSRPSRDA